MLPEIVWRKPGPHVYLTFDDGPDGDLTPDLADLLRKHGAQATFFVLGEKAARHPDVVRHLLRDGHTIGNHGFSHRRLLGTPRRHIDAEVGRTDRLLRAITGRRPRLFRPPYGWFGPGLLHVLKANEYRLVLWNRSTHDYREATGAPQLVQRLQRVCAPGNIVLLHDGHRHSAVTLDALRRFFNHPGTRGLSFRALPE